MEGICQQDFKSRTQAIAPEGGLILTKLTKRRTRFFFTGEFVSVTTIPGPTALIGQTSLRLEDAYVYELEALAEPAPPMLPQLEASGGSIAGGGSSAGTNGSGGSGAAKTVNNNTFHMTFNVEGGSSPEEQARKIMQIMERQMSKRLTD